MTSINSKDTLGGASQPCINFPAAELLDRRFPGRLALLLIAVEAAMLGDEASGKRPIGAEFNKKAVARFESGVGRDEHIAQIAEHLKSGGNVGWVVAPGALVLDVDDDQSVAWLSERLPDTPRQKTRDGRMHFFLKAPDCPLSAKVKVPLANGAYVDLRVAGKSQIVVEPSVHFTGANYKFEIPLPENLDDLPTCPPDIVDAIATLPFAEQTESKRGSEGLIYEGERNSRLFALGCRLRENSETEEEFKAQFRALNESKCRPPLPAKDMETLIRSVSKRTQLLDLSSLRPSPIEGVSVARQRVGAGPNLVVLSSVEPRSVEWLWPGYIPRGKLTDVVGDGDLGKSLVMLDLAARESTGRGMPDEQESVRRKPGSVVLLVAEDDLADTVVPRLIAAGADLDRIVALEGPRMGVERPIVFPDDVAQVEAAIRDTSATLLIIDPVMAFLGDIKTGIDSAVRAGLLGPLKMIAGRYGCAVLNLRHTNKTEGASASMRGGGSVAFRNATRAGLAFGPDHDDETGRRRIMAPSKGNLTTPHEALAYHIESTHGLVPIEGITGTPVVVWDGVAFGVTAGQVLGPAPKPSGPRENSKTGEATLWLKDRLQEGPAKATEIRAEMEALGYSKKVIDDAKRYAGVESERVSFGNSGDGHSLWSLK